MATQTDAEKSASSVSLQIPFYLSVVPFQLTLSCLYQIGAVNWIEIPATNLTRVQAFYSTVFGWNYPPSPVPADPNCSEETSYVMFNRGNTNGGFSKVSPENFLSPALHPDNPEKARISVRVILNVESVDEALITIEKAGGTVYM